MALRQALRQRAPTLRPLAAALLECHATVPRRAASSSGSTAAAAEYERLQSELERVKERMATLAADYPEVRSAHAAHDAFPPPKKIAPGLDSPRRRDSTSPRRRSA